MSAWDIGLSLRQASRSHGGRIAARTLTVDGQHIAEEVTWAELHKDVQLLSKMMTEMPVLRRGDRLGVLGRNSVQYLKLMYACVEAGVIFVPLNFRSSVDELRHAVADSGINVVAVIDRDFFTAAVDLIQPTGLASAVSWLILAPWANADSYMSSFGHSFAAYRWQLMPVGLARCAVVGHNSNPDEGVINVSDGLKLEITRTVGLHEILHHGEAGVATTNALDNAPNAPESENANSGCEDVFCIVFTSGTTGRPKGVALTHLGQVMQAMGKCLHVGYTSSTVFLSVVPFFHVGGISSSLAVTMAAGCHVFLPRFTPASGSAAVKVGGVNTLVVVPTMLHMILGAVHSSQTAGECKALDSTNSSPLAGVKTVLVGGQPLSRKLERLARSCMPAARFIQTYACTEAGSTITFTCSSRAPHDKPQGPATADCGTSFDGLCDAMENLQGVTHEPGGRPAAHVEVRIAERGHSDKVSVRCCAPGVVGEIETRGPHVMKGYWGRPELTNEAIRADGWLRTGDLGRLEEGNGCLLFVGRVKDVIKTGGENVHASEVEDVLLRHNWVVEAAAYGVEDDRLGEKVAASVVLGDAAQDETGAVTRDRARTVLTGFCGLHLSHYKRPRRIDIVPALPRNSAGKVLRHRLRASL